jgi:hypothetical protein
MNAIMNERAHQGFMICYTNIDKLTDHIKCYMHIHVHKCLTSRHDYSHNWYRIG